MASRVESETVVVWNQAENVATITTSAVPTVNRLLKLGHTEETGDPRYGGYLHRFVVPRRCVRFGRLAKRGSFTLDPEEEFADAVELPDPDPLDPPEDSREALPEADPRPNADPDGGSVGGDLVPVERSALKKHLKG